ncbi:MAG: rhodanese-like domain-containing protein [Flammeovirgaceae bacterium]|nr:rhodanese-like domain-containing protein [Flammeovirgaceae bacterium]
MKEISVSELKALQDSEENFQLIDVREANEYEFANLGGELIPLSTVMANEGKFSRDKKVIVHCRSGARSANAILQLESAFGLDNLYNLKGGILAYADEIDNSIPKY